MSQAQNPEHLTLNGQTVSLQDYIQEHDRMAEENARLKQTNKKAVRRYRCEQELKPYQAELIRLQGYLEEQRRRMIILFEGRDHPAGHPLHERKTLPRGCPGQAD